MKNLIFIPEESDFIFDTNKKYKHSGDLGDIIYSLPVMRFYGGGHLFLSMNSLPSVKYDGSHSGMTEEKFKIIKPLLEIQNYISSVEYWNKNNLEINIDFDLFRYKSSDYKNLCHKICSIFNVHISQSYRPWLSCMPRKVAKLVINRTHRYRNENLDYSILKENFSDAIFIGYEDEHKDFQERFGKIDFYPTKNLLEAAEVIAGSELFIGNQSVCMAIAIGMGHNNIQEYFPQYSDCIFDHPNCEFFYVGKNKT